MGPRKCFGITSCAARTSGTRLVHSDAGHQGAASFAAGLATLGVDRLAAAGIMIAVFYTFAIAGTLPMKEMGLILGTAVLLDAFVVRLVLVMMLVLVLGFAVTGLMVYVLFSPGTGG